MTPSSAKTSVCAGLCAGVLLASASTLAFAQAAPDAATQAPAATGETAPAEKIAPPSSSATSPSAAPVLVAPAPQTSPAPAATATGLPAANLPAVSDVAVGSVVFGSDGKRLGKIDSVTQYAGSVSEIHVHVGGLFGFFGKTVAVPAEKITKSGQTVQVGLTSEEVDKLPDLKS